MYTNVQCPNCGSFATQPTHATGFLARDRDFWASTFGRFSFENPKWVQKFRSGKIKAYCTTCNFTFDVRTTTPRSTPLGKTQPQARTSAERLGELEQLKAKGLVTEEEYKRKRQEIIKGV